MGYGERGRREGGGGAFGEVSIGEMGVRYRDTAGRQGERGETEGRGGGD